MKILLTGAPKSGKTTLLGDLISGISPKRGMVAVGVPKDGERIGFDLMDNEGNTAALARVGQPTEYPVSRYFVDVNSLDNFIEPLFVCKPEQLLYIDEIGQMQLYSDRFKKLVEHYLAAPNDYIGTFSAIHHDPFIEAVKHRADVFVCTVTPENREDLKAAIREALEHRNEFNSLPTEAQRMTLALAGLGVRQEDLKFVPLRKLFKNAVTYVAEDKVRAIPEGFIVRGNTNTHRLIKNQNRLICDCDLFNGRGAFAGMAGECSHTQAVKISESKLD